MSNNMCWFAYTYTGVQVKRGTWNKLRKETTTGAITTSQLPGKRHRREDSWKSDIVMGWITDHVKRFGMEGKAQKVDEKVESLHIYVTYLTREKLILTFQSWVQTRALVPGQTTTPDWVVKWAMHEMSQSLLFKLWLWRRSRPGSQALARLRYLADKGGLQGCPACVVLQWRYTQAYTQEERISAFGEMRMHVNYWSGERDFAEHGCDTVIESQKQLEAHDRLEGGQFDGYDVRKATVPITAGAPCGHFAHIEKKYGFYKIKVSGAILFGHNFIMLETPPWVGTGMNLAVTNMHLAWQKRAESPIPIGHKFLGNIDGGSENWARTTFLYFGWSVKLFPKGVYIQRLPVKHTYNDLDRGFQPGACFFWGRAGGGSGEVCMTLREWDEGMTKAYAGLRGSKFGGDLTRYSVDASWDWTAFFAPYACKKFEGWGHKVRYRQDPDTGLFYKGERGSLVHYLHFFCDTEGFVRLRYKFGASYPEDQWLPAGADGIRPIGLLPFTVPMSELPSGEDPPPLAAFHKDWTPKARDDLREAMVQCELQVPAMMTQSKLKEWTDYVDSCPLELAEVKEARKPVWKPLPFPPPQPVVAPVRPSDCIERNCTD